MDGIRIVGVRFKGGSSRYERDQKKAMAEQQELQKQLDAIDMEYYKLRAGNREAYDRDFRPLEEGLLQLSRMDRLPPAMSSEAVASTYDASLRASDAAVSRNLGRYGIANDNIDPDKERELVRALAISAVSQSADRSLSTEGVAKGALGIGAGTNTDVARGYDNAMRYQASGIGHSTAAFSNYSNAQQHLNNAYLHQQQGISSIISGIGTVANMGLSNSYSARYTEAINTDPNYNSYGPGWLSGGASTWW